MVEIDCPVDRPEPNSSDALVTELYTELRHVAAARLRKLPPGQTLQATALVHEAYLRLGRSSADAWQNRGHFFAAAAEAMRRILVDQARRKAALRRGNGQVPESLDGLELHAPEPDERLLSVNEALQHLEAENPGLAQVVKLHFFAGLKHTEVAALLDISEKTARRQWSAAKLWLFEYISANGISPF